MVSNKTTSQHTVQDNVSDKHRRLIFNNDEDNCVIVEGSEKREESMFRAQYDLAHDIFRELSADKSKDLRKTNNIIAFCGDRGSGKTSCMESFRQQLKPDQDANCLFLETIDPSFFDDSNNILGLVLGQMYNVLVKDERKRDRPYRSDKDDFAREQLLEEFKHGDAVHEAPRQSLEPREILRRPGGTRRARRGAPAARDPAAPVRELPRLLRQKAACHHHRRPRPEHPGRVRHVGIHPQVPHRRAVPDPSERQSRSVGGGDQDQPQAGAAHFRRGELPHGREIRRQTHTGRQPREHAGTGELLRQCARIQKGRPDQRIPIGKGSHYPHHILENRLSVLQQQGAQFAHRTAQTCVRSDSCSICSRPWRTTTSRTAPHTTPTSRSSKTTSSALGPSS